MEKDMLIALQIDGRLAIGIIIAMAFICLVAGAITLWPIVKRKISFSRALMGVALIASSFLFVDSANALSRLLALR